MRLPIHPTQERENLAEFYRPVKPSAHRNKHCTRPKQI